MAISIKAEASVISLSFKLTAISSNCKLPTQPFRLVQLIIVRMACYLYSEGESWPAIPACNCHYIGQSCCQIHTLFSISPDHRLHDLAAYIYKSDKLRCANVDLYLHYNTCIVQCRSG